MDQAPIQEIDVHEGLESTLTILSHKLKRGNIIVTRVLLYVCTGSAFRFGLLRSPL